MFSHSNCLNFLFLVSFFKLSYEQNYYLKYEVISLSFQEIRKPFLNQKLKDSMQVRSKFVFIKPLEKSKKIRLNAINLKLFTILIK
jgi:hypothetical protein